MSRPRRRGVLAAALVLAAIVAVAVAFVASGSGGDGRGPLVPLFDGAIGDSFYTNLGHSWSISGPLIIRNTSDQEVVLDRVAAVGLRDRSPRIVGAYVLSRLGDNFWARHGYRVPPTGRSVPGAIVGPHAKVQLVFGVKATKLGRHTFTAVDILYHVGAVSYRASVAYEIAICAPFRRFSCPDPLEASSAG